MTTTKGIGYNHISTGTKGAIHELQVSADMMLAGYDVFRSLSPNATCDLVAVKNGKCYRVEVTTGSLYRGKKLYYPPHKQERYDILAVVSTLGIDYSPSIERGI